MIPQIDLRRQHAALRDELLEAAARVVASSRFILGPEVRAFEEELAACCGARHGIGVNSGTDALLLALKAVGVAPGDEVITSPFSFVASASTIALVGATPVYVDIDPQTFNLDPDRLAAAITPRTRAIVPVHLFGQPAPMDRIETIARARGVAVIADAAQAVGARYDGAGVAAWGDAVCLSFYPTKNLGGCGDGGMVLTTREDVAERVRLLRDHGAPQRYLHVELGVSSRLDELQAALLRVKLRRLGEWNEARRRLAARYAELLAGLPLTLPVERPPAWHVYHQYTVRHVKRDALARLLGELGIGTAIHYPTILPSQPLFARRRGPPAVAEDAFPHAAQAASEVLSLPCFPELGDDEIEQVAEAVKQALARL
ncbi:MAG TPA: DegT/DnrJ/EryC1/StrS family aminotransferase [Methylomirabilota bacterium]|jgi:dTDP-4-amino-4,6-dideoxygalactose transaminase|nr:DegT/DnrJ/EryC1/StrS family aminotransferase [Methylomirabilota bacterium]